MLGKGSWWRRRNEERELIAKIDGLLMEYGLRAARARVSAPAVLPQVETVIGSLSRMRVGIVEGRRLDMARELAALREVEDDLDRALA